MIAAYVCLAAVSLWIDGQVSADESTAREEVEPTVAPSQVEISTELEYLVQLPTGYEADESTEWPVVLFLHGAGERGNNLDAVRKWGPPRLVDAGKDLPAIVVSPQCPVGKWWENTPLLTLLDEIEREYRVDTDRIYVTGLSMGGYGTWALVTAAPERFAAAVPICGGMSNSPARLADVKRVPFWAFHGTEDRVVPLSETVNAVEAIRQAGGTAKLTVYEDVGHASWRKAYAEETMWAWLFKQRRNAE